MSQIKTYTGRLVSPLAADACDIDIRDIAHALSNQCRWSGHTRQFYSVGDHSVRVSLICDPQDALWGLLHDASEAYLVDLPRPLKDQEVFGAAYRRAEAHLMRTICEAFRLPEAMPESVRRADDVLLWTEARDLMDLEPPPEWRGERLSQTLRPLGATAAKMAFMARYYELTGERRATA